MTNGFMTSQVLPTRHLLGILRSSKHLALAAGLLLTCHQPILASPPVAATAVPVRVNVATGMTRGDKPYFVKGAGGGDKLKQLASRGGNSLRTWTTGGLDTILREANQL